MDTTGNKLSLLHRSLFWRHILTANLCLTFKKAESNSKCCQRSRKYGWQVQKFWPGCNNLMRSMHCQQTYRGSACENSQNWQWLFLAKARVGKVLPGDISKQTQSPQDTVIPTAVTCTSGAIWKMGHRQFLQRLSMWFLHFRCWSAQTPHR